MVTLNKTTKHILKKNINSKIKLSCAKNKIIDIKSRQILDSRGNPTLEVEVICEFSKGSFKVPSGASTGINEAVELRDNIKSKYFGKSVTRCVKIIKQIKKYLIGLNSLDQKLIDKTLLKLDGTKNKSKLGANTILGISVATSRAAAKYINIPYYKYLNSLLTITIKPKIPTPFCNILNGGKHASNNLNFQEFMIVPQGSSFKQNTRIVSEVYHTLKKIISLEYGDSQTNVGDEGGFAPNLDNPYDALNLIIKAIKKSKHTSVCKIAMDPASSEFYNTKTKLYEVTKNLHLDYKKLTKYYLDLIKNYPIVSLEDGFAENNYIAWKTSLPTFKKVNVQIVGDDLLCTNPKLIKKAIKEKLCNSLLLKVNQIGTLTESLTAFELAHSAGWTVMVSHRSGETEDSFIADLAVALGCGQIKIGAPCRSDRTSKYNRLLKIEEDFKH